MIKCLTKNTLRAWLRTSKSNYIVLFKPSRKKKKNCVPKKADMKAYLKCEWFKQLKTIGNFIQLQTYLKKKNFYMCFLKVMPTMQ